VILIDQARWWFNGRRWCHLISDESVEELIEFADRNEINRRAFQGDHHLKRNKIGVMWVTNRSVEVSSRKIAPR